MELWKSLQVRTTRSHDTFADAEMRKRRGGVGALLRFYLFQFRIVQLLKTGKSAFEFKYVRALPHQMIQWQSGGWFEETQELFHQEIHTGIVMLCMACNTFPPSWLPGHAATLDLLAAPPAICNVAAISASVGS